MLELKLECTCLSEDAKWNLEGVLNTVELLGEGNLRRLKEEIKGMKREGKKVPEYEKMALKHLESDLAITRELRRNIRAIPECSK